MILAVPESMIEQKALDRSDSLSIFEPRSSNRILVCLDGGRKHNASLARDAGIISIASPGKSSSNSLHQISTSRPDSKDAEPITGKVSCANGVSTGPRETIGV
ncbi:MAG: hypothetical protein WCK51_15480 [Armatimonadota bacterium]